MIQFFAINNILLLTFLYGVFMIPGECAENSEPSGDSLRQHLTINEDKMVRPLREIKVLEYEGNNKAELTDINDYNQLLSSVSPSSAGMAKEQKEVKKSLTKGEKEEIEALARAERESRETLIEYKLQEIDVLAKKEKHHKHKKKHKKSSASKRDQSTRKLSPKADNVAKLKQKCARYEDLNLDEKQLVQDLCKENVDDLLITYTGNLLSKIQLLQKAIESEMTSIELACNAGQIQVEPEDAECIQLNLIEDERILNFMQKEYQSLVEEFWSDKHTPAKITKIVMDALQIFNITDQDDIGMLAGQFISQMRNKGKIC